jgi:hypothetical protein
MVSDPAYALGPTILAAVGYVLHPAASGLARVAADLDRRAAVDDDRRLGPARCRPLIPGNGLLTAMQRLDAPAFWKYIGIFGILATVNVVLVLFTFWSPRHRSFTGGCGSTSGWPVTG